MKKLIKITLITILSIFAVFFAVYALVFLTPPTVKFSEDLLIKSVNNTNYYDLENKKIELNKIGFTSIEINELNEHTKQAFIAIEDKNFYNHNGIQFKRIIGATLKNIKSRSYTQGASTISQQLIKNTHLTNEKTLKRKINEIKLTKILEKQYSKDKILEMYLNNIYFGENCYGIEQASLKYFSKSAKNLDINESATLAGMIVAPSKLNPIKNIKECKNRRNVVLKQMTNQGYIKNINSFINEDIMLKINDNYDVDNSYFKAVDNELNKLKDEHPYLYKNCNVYTGYKKEQQLQLKTAYPETDTDYQAMIIDNKTNLVNAYFSTCGEIERSPASTVKPWLVYAPCIEEGIITRHTIIKDEKISFGNYSPQNYGDKYYGNISCEKALNMSLNIPAIKLLNSVSVEKAKAYASKMDIDIDSNTLGIALGSFNNNIKLKNLLSTFSTLANYGKYTPCSFIRKITDKNGNTLFESDSKATQVFSEGTASITTEMLKSTAKIGTGRALSITDFDIAAKTGTNGNEKGNLDAYSVAYTANHTFGVWLGNKDNSLMKNRITGSNEPTLALRRIINNTYKDNKPETLPAKGVVIKTIDKLAYENDGELLLANDEQIEKNTFKGMFLLGKEPKTYAPKISESLKVNYNLKCENQTVYLNYELKPKQFIIIYRIEHGKKVKVYEGNNTNFFESLKYDGVFEYELTAYVMLNNEKIFGEPVKTEKIKITNNLDSIVKDNWWNDGF